MYSPPEVYYFYFTSPLTGVKGKPTFLLTSYQNRVMYVNNTESQ